MSSNNRSKIFLLGVGCQKGGTTWLHDYLCSNPLVDLGFLKEYHVFDALSIPDCRVFMSRKINALRVALDSNKLKQSKTLLKQVEFYVDPDAYYSYFDFLHYQNRSITVVGDITPSYAGLSESVFAYIKKNLELRDFKVKVIFLMRDPFERIWSQVRMQRKYSEKRRSETPSLNELDELIDTYSKSVSTFRTQYELTIPRLENVFPAESIHYEFYENLFNDASIKKITDFLEIPFIRPQLNKFFNSSPKTNPTVPESIIREIVNFYSDTYFFCSEKFGDSKISELWPNIQYVRH